MFFFLLFVCWNNITITWALIANSLCTWIIFISIYNNSCSFSEKERNLNLLSVNVSHNEYFHMQLKGLSVCIQNYSSSYSKVFFVSKATLELKSDFLSWKSEVKVPVVEKKLIWVCMSGRTVIPFSFQLYFYPCKLFWKLSGSLIVNWSARHRTCIFFWSCAFSAVCDNVSDQSSATRFKQENTRSKQFPEG